MWWLQAIVGGILEGFVPGTILEPFGVLFGLLLGSSWSALEVLLEHLGYFLEPLALLAARSLGAPWAIRFCLVRRPPRSAQGARGEGGLGSACSRRVRREAWVILAKELSEIITVMLKVRELRLGATCIIHGVMWLRLPAVIWLRLPALLRNSAIPWRCPDQRGT